MGMKLFGDDGVGNYDISNIEIDKEFARRYEHNKKREDLQRYEELKKQGRIVESESESDLESSHDEGDNDIPNPSRNYDVKFFANLIKVRNRDPSLYRNDINLFESESDNDGKEEKGRMDNEKKKKPMYLKDVAAQHLIEEGPDFEEVEMSKKRKTYNEEQEELKKAFLDAVKDAEEDGEGGFLKMKEKNDVKKGDDDGGDFQRKLGEYFGQEGELDENNVFLKEFFMNKMWLDMGNKLEKKIVEDGEMDDLLRDEEEIERQEQYEEKYNFRFQENMGDRVMGHSRKAEGSVRKKENTRKEQRKSKEERMKVAEMERKEELKHLKNLKKKEMKERMQKVMEAAGIKENDDCPLALDDLEEDFNPKEYDKMMKKAFDEKYYDAEDIDPEFGSDSDGYLGNIGKPDFDKEDEMLGLPKGWDAVENGDGFLAARDRILKRKAENGNEDDDEEVDGEDLIEKGGGNGEDISEESKRKRKRKISLVKKAREEMMEEFYKLDYEDTIGDLKTRFRYTKVNPNRYGMKTKEIIMMDDKELNQYVSIKKLAPYGEEWKLPNQKRYHFKKRVRELFVGKSNDQKTDKTKRSKDNGDKSTSVLGSQQYGKTELEESNIDMSNLSRGARRKCRQKELKLSHNRLKAYGKIQPKAKSKGKHSAQ